MAVLTSLLNELSESGRGLIELSKRPNAPEMVSLLKQLAQDEGRFGVMLRHHIQRLGATPSNATGNFYEKLIAREGLAAQMALLDRGQSAVALMLVDTLPRLRDEELHADLRDMYDVHLANIAKANQQSEALN